MISLTGTQLAVVTIGAGLGFLLLRAVLRREADRVIVRLIWLGLLAKLAGSAARYTFMAELYDGRGDFNRYFENGTALAGQIRSGALPSEAHETGTPFMDFIVGVVYTFAPHHLAVGFLVFASLSFLGALLFLQAFRLSLPEGNHRLYAALVFFTPTMVFWPSSIGKEAWLVFTLGVATYGAARVLRSLRWGYLAAACGGVGVFLVRPHMGALFALAFAGAYLLRVGDRSVRSSVVAWGFGLVLVASGAAYAYGNFGDELPRDESVEGSETDQITAETDRRTRQGGSAFDSRPVRSPGDLGHALMTVPFRPFPHEGHNRQAQIAGLEGIILLGIVAFSLPRMVALLRRFWRSPYLAMCGAYSLGFVIAFSNVGNFGILTRQRAQLLPLLFVLIALPRLRGHVRRSAPPPPLLAATTVAELDRLENPALGYTRPTTAAQPGSKPRFEPDEHPGLREPPTDESPKQPNV